MACEKDNLLPVAAVFTAIRLFRTIGLVQRGLCLLKWQQFVSSQKYYLPSRIKKKKSITVVCYSPTCVTVLSQSALEHRLAQIGHYGQVYMQTFLFISSWIKSFWKKISCQLFTCDVICSELVFTCATAFIQNGHFTTVRHAQINQKITWLMKDGDLSSD